MFWRIIEWTFMLIALVYGARAVYRLWKGPKISTARTKLHRAEEAEDAAYIERKARRVEKWTDVANDHKPSPKEPDDVQ